ncbi:hypothetical protein ALT1644_370019 [Alteromonas macleodii]
MLKISKKRARNTPHHSFEGMHRFRNALKTISDKPKCRPIK